VKSQRPDFTGQLAAAVLSRLHPTSPGGLVGLGFAERERSLEHLRALARRTLPGSEDVAGDWAEETDDPFRLAELAFESRGEDGAAAAVYALEHDRLLGREDGASAFLRCALRWRLGRALLTAGAEPQVSTGIAVLERTVGLLGALARAAAGPPALRAGEALERLRFHVHELLATGYRLQGDPFRAAAHLATAACLDLEPRLLAAVVVLEAEALVEAGYPADARWRILSEWPRLAASRDLELLARGRTLLAAVTARA
jgi:hypothetical protein